MNGTSLTATMGSGAPTAVAAVGAALGAVALMVLAITIVGGAQLVVVLVPTLTLIASLI